MRGLAQPNPWNLQEGGEAKPRRLDLQERATPRPHFSDRTQNLPPQRDPGISFVPGQCYLGRRKPDAHRPPCGGECKFLGLAQPNPWNLQEGGEAKPRRLDLQEGATPPPHFSDITQNLSPLRHAGISLVPGQCHPVAVNPMSISPLAGENANSRPYVSKAPSRLASAIGRGMAA